MRISGGKFRGRKLIAPAGKDVRPATDQVRQAVFNMLLSYGLPEDAIVLDAFCGSGSYGLEALSRGGKFCTFMDNGRAAEEACNDNRESLDVATSEISQFIKCNIEKAVSCPESKVADLVFLDPPYAQGLVPPALEALQKQGWLKEGAICIIECEKELGLTPPEGFTEEKQKTYGKSKILIWQYL